MIPLGIYPTPVERLTPRPAGRALWVKRDDQTNPIYGGSKVRKLERILGDAKSRGAKRIVTVGAVGSHHVLATAIFAREIGVPVEAVLVAQPRSPHVVQNLCANVALGIRILKASSYAHAAARLAARIVGGAYYVPVGGSNLSGTLGYVEAARELALQVRSGLLPEPDVVVVALGSGGTAAGLAAGFALEGMRTRLVAVTISDPAFWVAHRACAFAREAAQYEAKRLGVPVPAIRLEIDARYLGPGYGHPTDAGRRALALAAEMGITLDLTYTAKAFAAALDRLDQEPEENVLFWHTLSSAPMDPWLTNAPAETELDASLRALLR